MPHCWTNKVALLLLVLLFSVKTSHGQDVVVDDYSEDEMRLPKQPFQPVKVVLLNSAGGEGTSYIMAKMVEWNVTMNHFGDHDRLKHRDARTYWASGKVGSGQIEAVVHAQTRPYNPHVESFNRVVYLLGDPLHSILSTARRFGFGAFHRGKLGCFDCAHPPPQYLPPHSRDEMYAAMFNRTEALGRDAYGWHFHLSTWVEAQRDDQHCACWPPIWIVDLETLIRNPCIFSQFIGVPLEKVQTLTWRPSEKFAKEEQGTANKFLNDRTRQIYDDLAELTKKIVRFNLKAYAEIYQCTPVVSSFMEHA